ncbi:MAG: Fic family protein [Flavobacteriales bacterium]|nr:Fic family protein [Flavobacteriales bacterium]
MNWKLNKLPFEVDVETKLVLKRLTRAHRALAELKGVAQSIPRQDILINSLILQEAKDSSEVENIVTTHDELYRSNLQLEKAISPAAKEVQNYVSALKRGFELVKKNDVLTSNNIIELQEVLEKNNAGFRKVPGTNLKNQRTGEVIYTPPQDGQEIILLMNNLEQFINDQSLTDYDPITKMAIIHFQFESIHPFYDGNGRTGRIINILFLVLNELLEIPILYLSRYIIKHKSEYYKHLQEIRNEENWESWLIFMITGVEEIANETCDLIREIKIQMSTMKNVLRTNYKFYSQDLLNHLFKQPYTKIEYLVTDLNVSRVTASGYLNKLAKDGVLKKQKVGKSNYYINEDLVRILIN